ncbi:hypothetical protein RvY_11192 [Ramazzottius varieornatus]|uniref:Uncharacterized protein n=1 Tax=Ramazzottius varieornatus TaxID=947166 RepID=A0A1D1VFB1_RAMVA|nr:hypothetical protein RvY_11192 [Ramazzottius varieornatus]
MSTQGVRRSSRALSHASQHSDNIPEDEDATINAISTVHRSAKHFVLVQKIVDQKMRAINFGQVRGGNWVKIRMDKESHLDENGLRVGDHIVAYFGPTEKSKPGYYSTIVRGVYDDK